jgi:hypothetical protein
LSGDFAVLHQSEGGDALDAELTGDLLLLVGIHFYKNGLANGLGGGFGELGGHHLTRSTPGCPEVDDHRQRAL